MAPMKKSMKKAVTSISNGGLADALATATELKKSECMKVLMSLADVVSKEVKKTGEVTIPGVAMVKTRLKPAGGEARDVRQGRRGEGQASQDTASTQLSRAQPLRRPGASLSRVAAGEESSRSQ